MPQRPRLISSLPPHLPIAVRRHRQCDSPGLLRDEVVHDHSGIGLYLSGTTRFFMRHDYTLVRGDLILIPEGMPHCASGESDGELIGVALCTGCMGGSWGPALRERFQGIRGGKVALLHLSEASTLEVESLLLTLAEELSQNRPHQRLMVDGLMSQLTAHIARASAVEGAESAQGGCPPVVAQALAYIEQNTSGSISLREVSQAVGRSPAHLAALMKQHTGRSVVEWITHGRMALARQLLLSSDEGIEGIAEVVGYASTSHFHRTFKRLHALTPGEWRQVHRVRAGRASAG